MTSAEMYGPEWCRGRRIPIIHMARMVQSRELGNRKPGYLNNSIVNTDSTISNFTVLITI